MLRTNRLLAALLAGLLLLAACGGDDGDDDAAPTTTDTTVADEAGLDDEPGAEGGAAGGGTRLNDSEIARQFFEAVVEGDRELGAALATDEVVAFWEPWDPSPGLEFSEGADGVFFISPGAAPFQCRVDEGVVVECLDEGAAGADEGDLENGDGPDTDVRFIEVEPGGEDTVVEDAIVRGDPRHLYVFDAPGGVGQTLNVSITSVEDNASFFVFGPNGEELASDTTQASIELQESGTYEVEVGPTRGNATYELRINVAELAD